MVQTPERVLVVLTTVFLLGVAGAQIQSLDETRANTNIIPSAPSASTAKGLKSYHDGGLRDISAVGKRDIGCKSGPGSQYSPEIQAEMGRSYAKEVEARSNLINDPATIEYVNRIGQNLVRDSDTSVQLSINIIKSDRINAFSLPGGYVFLDSGLILAAENEAELAGVISHEIAHVAACHAAQAMAREEATSVASMPLIFRIMFRRIALNTMYLKPARSMESEADLLGAEYLYKAGYDPHGLSSFLARINSGEKQKGGGRGNTLDSRPEITDRVQRIQQQIRSLLPPAPEYKIDSSEFQEIKERLSEAKSGHRTEKNHEGNSGSDDSQVSTADVAAAAPVEPR